MNVGEKVRELRNAKMMSQSELAGDRMTRNMISCIENGTATPSLSTVFYLAKKLGVSVGYLLAEEGDDRFYRKMAQKENLKKAIRDGDWEDCRQICETLDDEKDDEILFLLAKSNFEIAKKEFWAGKLHCSCTTFDKALEYSQKSLYSQPEIEAEASVYFAYLQRISPTLFSDVLDDSPLQFVSRTPFAAYVAALEALEAGNLEAAERYLHEFAEQDFFSEHLRAKLECQSGAWENAQRRLENLLQASDHLLNEIQLYAVLSDLELVCKEMEDYKAAYRYASERVQLHEQLLKN